MKNIVRLVTLLLLLTSVASVSAPYRVIGYIPAYKDLTGIIDNVDLTKLTHINVSFLNPDQKGLFFTADGFTCMSKDEDGTPVDVNDIRYVIKQAHQSQVKVLLSLGGGVLPTCTGDWAQLLQPQTQPLIVKQLIDLVDKLNLDGLDIDLEGIVLTRIDQANNYTPFIKALSQQLTPRGKLLTTATASYEGGMVPISSLPYFDFVNLMSYDGIGPSWGIAGSQHATYQQALRDVQLWQSRGLAQDKLVLGLPFYGYGFGQYKPNYAIKDILSEFGVDALNQDVIGQACDGCDYITYNGIKTIQAKTQLALKQGSGVMIWELSHDAVAPNSLLQVIQNEINQFETN